jgi:hypothetical protein
MRLPHRFPLLVGAAAVVTALVVGIALFGPIANGPSVAVSLTALNGSGVTGTVTLTTLANGRTRVAIEVADGGNPDMPAHIHPGRCPDTIPQPEFPLENVRQGRSVTEVPASMAELTDGTLALNIHKAIDDLRTTTACVDLG